MEKSSPVTKELDSKSIPYQLFQHSSPPHSLEQAAQERSQKNGQVVRSILFRIEEGNYLMVLVGGPLRISWAKLREMLGVSRMTMAGYRTGAVAPFGLPHPIKILVDESVLKEEEISLGSGIRGTAVLMKSQDLLKALGDEAEVGNYVEE
jgi:prolyl-tRNA editing enzyme YbaK/EbsC (Cys-tRNA(Pro) deacylase)